MLNFLLGLIILIFGFFLTRHQVKIFKKKEQSKYGYDLRLLLLGILLVFFGIFLIFGIN
jgi:uncharacterized membrane protein YidH (DUF202 family)